MGIANVVPTPRTLVLKEDMMAFDRRSILLASSLGGAALALGCDEKRDVAPEGTSPSSSQSSKTAEEGKKTHRIATLVVVADRIYPPEPSRQGPGALGAKALGAEAYFIRLFADQRMTHLWRPLERGADFLNRGASLESKVNGFADLSTTQQDSWLDRLNRDKVRQNGLKGSQWMRVMCALTLEAVLGDPKHGGNAEKQTWTWLGYSEHGRGSPT